MKFFQLFCVWKTLHFVFIFERHFTESKILIWRCFFQYLIDTALCLLVSMVSDESWRPHLCFFINNVSFFPLSAFKIFTLSLFLRNLNMMCHSVIFLIILVFEFTWDLWMGTFIVYIKFENFIAIMSSDMFSVYPSLSFWDFHYTFVSHLKFSYSSLMPFSFFNIFYSCFASFCIIFISVFSH